MIPAPFPDSSPVDTDQAHELAPLRFQLWMDCSYFHDLNQYPPGWLKMAFLLSCPFAMA
jgi:hypothetical protein